MKKRSVLIILITLVIGFIIGMLTSAQLRYHKLKPVRMFFSEERFREGLYNTIQPSEEQKVEIQEVISKYAAEMSDMQMEFRKNFDAKMKAFRKEIDSKLTKEQLTRLREMDEKRQEMIRQNRKKYAADSVHRNFRRPYGTNTPSGFKDTTHQDTTR